MNATISGSRKRGGFSLVEMAIVLAIVSLLLAGLLPTISGQIEQQRRNETRKQLAEIQQALLGFAIMNGRLPCPTTMANPADATYGQEPAGGCAGVPAPPDGYLPWKTLGVSEIDAWGSKRTGAGDPWTGYWRYRVDRSYSNSLPFNLSTGFTDNLSVIDSGGNTITSGTEHPVAIVFSTGPNVTADGENSTANFNSVYQSDNPNPNFDDILVWISRPQLFNRMVAAGKLP
ncbi:MAG: type II secretion system protein [Sideroxydans sp.]